VAAAEVRDRAIVYSAIFVDAQVLCGLERRWNVDMNSIKVWGGSLAQCEQELPSREVQQLALDIAANKAEIQRLRHSIAHAQIMQAKTPSPIRFQLFSEQLESFHASFVEAEHNIDTLERLTRELQAEHFHEDDVYCLHEAAQRADPLGVSDGSEKRRRVLFSGGISATVFVWDLEVMHQPPHRF